MVREVALIQQRAALAEARLAAADAEVAALRRRHEVTLALLCDSERRRIAAEHWLAEHRASASWRLTEPVRRVVRFGAKRRHVR